MATSENQMLIYGAFFMSLTTQTQIKITILLNLWIRKTLHIPKLNTMHRREFNSGIWG